jgi:hypothetical protein
MTAVFMSWPGRPRKCNWIREISSERITGKTVLIGLESERGGEKFGGEELIEAVGM